MTGPAPGQFRELAELEALRQLKARYFYYIDTKQWDLWLGLFTVDATLAWDSAVSTGGRDGDTRSFTGLDAIKENVVRGILNPTTSVHQGHTPVLEIISDTEARGIWPMEDIVVATHLHRLIHGWGHYHETYRKVDGAWKIASSHLTRLLLQDTGL
ncbi:nuclear transport factor 2 family protein [Mycobacterium branderi]|uniref:nuclear transport factor 2 family protein n=1 Tax=Mycobacterium branderi TaxID=43348 RepID=UPI001E439E12|nr:nuclear transport factor 2 family protein [Mycobacterium branderi]